jgi:hypothetical protein
VEVAHGGRAEAELNRPIEKRSAREMDSDEKEELWKASVRAYNARRREEVRAAWQEYHRGQAERHRAILERLIADHEAQGEMYRLGPEGG